MTVKKNFINEFGKIITIEVSTGVLRENGKMVGPMMQMEIVGPDSSTSNMVTPMEGALLRDALIEEIWTMKELRITGGRVMMMRSPLDDTERFEAIVLRIVETTGLSRDIVVKLMPAFVEALDHFKVMLMLKPEAMGYLTNPDPVAPPARVYQATVGGEQIAHLEWKDLPTTEPVRGIMYPEDKPDADGE